MEHEKAAPNAIEPGGEALSPATTDSPGTVLHHPHDRSVLNAADAEEEETQEGVKAIEAISKAWSKRGLVAAYLGIFLLAFTTSLEGQVTFSVIPFATSAFKSHSLIATIYVIRGVVNAVIKPPMAKIADVFGRLTAFSISVALYILGYIQMAASTNVQTFAAAQVFYSAGATGLQVLQQVLVADTSDLLNRALLSSLPDAPFLVTTWIGSPIGAAIVANGKGAWRWALGLWAVVLPVVFAPLALTLFLSGRRARKLARRQNQQSEKRKSAVTKSRTRGSCFSRLGATIAEIWNSLDVGGILLLSAAFALILIPLTLTEKTPGGWRSARIVALIVVGAFLLVAFPFYEASRRLAPHPVIPLDLLRSRTFCAGCGIGFFYFLVFYLSVQPYFYSYLLVVQRQSVSAAGYITQTFNFTSTISSILVSILIKYTRRYKPFVIAGSLVYLLGIGLMMHFRTTTTGTGGGKGAVGALVATQIVVGLGGGMLVVPAQLGVQAATASHQQVAAATAVFLTIVQIGGAVGAAVSGAVWTRLVPKKLGMYLPSDTTVPVSGSISADTTTTSSSILSSGAGASEAARAIFGDVTIASNYTAYPAGSPARVAINRSYQETMHVLLIIAVVMCAPLVLLSFLMKNYHLDAVGPHQNQGQDQDGGNGKGSGAGSDRDGIVRGEEREKDAKARENGDGNGNANVDRDAEGSNNADSGDRVNEANNRNTDRAGERGGDRNESESENRRGDGNGNERGQSVDEAV
ncbi:siderophore iron transporter mirC [Nemania sp. FL0916]|nr:siderophore iron transporter mirC [Nemania sp. FL0916]